MDKLDYIYKYITSITVRSILKWLLVSFILVYVLSLDPMKFIIGSAIQQSFRAVKDTVSDDFGSIYNKILLLVSTDVDLTNQIKDLNSELDQLKSDNSFLKSKMLDMDELRLSNDSLKKDLLDAESDLRSARSSLESEVTRKAVEDRIDRTIPKSRIEWLSLILTYGTVVYKLYNLYMGYGVDIDTDRYNIIVAMLSNIISNQNSSNRGATFQDPTEDIIENLNNEFSDNDIDG